MSLVTVEKKGEVAIVTLNRPDQLNALSSALSEALGNAFVELEANDDVHVAILTGAGRAFCAGMDLKELGSGAAKASVAEQVRAGANPINAMARFSGPIIGAINGVAITGGFELALACDLLIASRKARFADTHGRVGLIPGWGLSQKLSRVIGLSRAKELSLTGNFLSAEKAEDWGLVNRVVAPEELLPVCEQLANDMATLVPGFLPDYKKLIDEGYALNFGEAMELEHTRCEEHNTAVSADALENRREGIRARGKAQTSG